MLRNVSQHEPNCSIFVLKGQGATCTRRGRADMGVRPAEGKVGTPPFGLSLSKASPFELKEK